MKLVVNGAEVAVDDRHAKTPLLWVLRDVLGMRGTKFGCGAGLCAACTVLIDGKNTKSCQTATERAVGKTITTVEGAAGPVVDAVRDAWYEGNVVQCGYCQPGQTLAAVALLEANPAPDDAAIDASMTGNLCRCGTYPRIRAAIHAAAGTLSEGREPAPLVAPNELEDRRLTRISGSTRTGRSLRSRVRSRWGRGSTPGWRRSLPRSSMPISIRFGSSMPRTGGARTVTSTETLTSGAPSS
jgi:aerobic-type carbon monoxide dehydrogenase small subunit (CoxS/CutS family)